MDQFTNPPIIDEVYVTSLPEKQELAAMDPRYLVFFGEKLIMLDGRFDALTTDAVAGLLLPDPPHFVASLGSLAFYAAVMEGDLPSGYVEINLRDPRFADHPVLFNLVSRAIQKIRFFRDHPNCERCEGEMQLEPQNNDWACLSCNAVAYPKIAPCVIVLVTRGEECLLARRYKATHKNHSLLAGFIEAGESAEHALVREVREEVGLEVKNIEYFGSQTWPFPNQLMFGYTAEWHSGEIVLEEAELSHGDWYHYTSLPPYPDSSTIAGKLIRHFLARFD